MNWKKHGTITISVDYARGVKAQHSDEALRPESIELRGFRLDTSIFGLPERKWMYPVNPDFLTESLGIPNSETGAGQLSSLSDEALEVLRNSLGNLHAQATRILNERGGARFGLSPGQVPPSLPPGRRRADLDFGPVDLS